MTQIRTPPHHPTANVPPAPHAAPPHHDDEFVARNHKSLGTLLRDLRDELTDLLRQEVALARTEVREGVGRAVRNVVFLAVGGVVAAIGLLFVLAAGAMLITAGLIAAGVDAPTAAWLGPLILGLVVALIGWALMQKAISTLRDTRMYPAKTVQTLKENARWLKEKTT